MKIRGEEGGEVETRGDEPPELARGRQQLVAIVVTLGGSIALVAAVGGLPLGTAAVELAIFGLIAVQLFRGAQWARWTVVVLTLLTAAGNGYNAARIFGDDPSWILNAGLAATYLFCAFILVFSAPLVAFMRARREAG